MLEVAVRSLQSVMEREVIPGHAGGPGPAVVS